ncbi:hypothetical protein [Spirosoma montaniterrae]|uniref:Uncharacterized protein n=1 Tax=Spirosoma montaniterrae TaxID=1178516 RepID=A0A1P9WR95_9BACT|nr:hypothetical protein [Spirosoma montaniterrae]AQG77889.1 hypothetical protein AWR27_00075 [Spirosoma montaniterrae]
MKPQLILAALLLFLSGCTRPATTLQRTKAADFDRALADSLLTLGFENEALYTLMSDLKPMSTLCDISLPLGRTDSAGVHDAIRPDQKAAYLTKLARWQTVLDALETPDVGFIIHPFRQDYDGKRIMQVSAYRRSRVQRMVADNQAFFGQWGFVPNSEPELVMHTIEYENQFDRWRGYGYLFGYPRHAVDFFVEAGKTQAATKGFVKRDFFQIPVASGKTGHFTYALPKGMKPTETDSTLYRQAGQVLERYRQLRPKYVGADTKLRALALWQDLQKTKP